MFAPVPSLGTDRYAELRRDFDWQIPARLNVAQACAPASRGDRPALIDLGAGSSSARRSATYADLAAWSTRLGHGLRSVGLARGDRVAVVLPQSLETIIAHLATHACGGVVVPLTTLFGVDALAYRIGDSGAHIVFTDVEHEELVREAAPEARVIVTSGSHEDQFWRLLAAGRDASLNVQTRSDDPALMIYTSGTTGPPKGALHAHRVIHGHLPGFEYAHNDFSRLRDSVSWTPADWAWIGGLFDLAMPTLFHGGTLVASRRRGFDPQEALRLLVDEGVTSTFLPPTALRMMANQITDPVTGARLHSVITGGESLDPRTSAWGHEVLDLRINEMYGQTEANFVAGGSHHWPDTLGHFGRPYPGHDVFVAGDEGQRLGPSEEGEIVVVADDPVVMLRYWENPEATERKVRSGLLYTGDRGVLHEDGAVRFVARDDDVINSAGFRIGPAEVESCLLEHPAVREAAVVGVPDELRGERVKAFIVGEVTDSDRRDDVESEIMAFVRERVGNYQYPREIEFISEIPKTTTGKLRRNALRERHRAQG